MLFQYQNFNVLRNTILDSIIWGITHTINFDPKSGWSLLTQ